MKPQCLNIRAASVVEGEAINARPAHIKLKRFNRPDSEGPLAVLVDVDRQTRSQQPPVLVGYARTDLGRLSVSHIYKKLLSRGGGGDRLAQLLGGRCCRFEL